VGAVREWHCGSRPEFSVIGALALPISVVRAGIFEVRAHYLVADELGAILRSGARLRELRRDLALRMVG